MQEDQAKFIKKKKDKSNSLKKLIPKKESGYDPESETDKRSEPGSETKSIMTDIHDMKMESYNKRIREDTGPGLVQPTIPATTTFELKGNNHTTQKDIPFSGKDHEDACKHLDEVNDIADYFNISNIPRETVLLRMLPVTFRGAAKD